MLLESHRKSHAGPNQPDATRNPSRERTLLESWPTPQKGTALPLTEASLWPNTSPMLSKLRKLFDRPGSFQVPLAPERVVSVVGDVHGCVALLKSLLTRLPGQIVLVGDLIDRGDESRAAVDFVMEQPDIVSLMGNHEAMLLAFLDDPVAAGPRWMRNGGLQTLASFGVGGDLSIAKLPRLRDSLALAMRDDRIEWLRNRPLYWTSGNLVVSHAGADPRRPLAGQSGALLWGHPECGRTPRSDGLWIAHGHVIVEEVSFGAGVIQVDTGAFAGGPLSAAILGEKTPKIVSFKF